MPPYTYMITYAFGRVKKLGMRKARRGLVASGAFCDTIAGRENGRERRQNGRRKEDGTSDG
jgi:hypothetical protein